MQMLKELLRGVDDKVMRLLYVCRRASLGTIVYTDSPESGATIDANSQPRPFPFFLMGNVPSRRLVGICGYMQAEELIIILKRMSECPGGDENWIREDVPATSTIATRNAYLACERVERTEKQEPSNDKLSPLVVRTEKSSSFPDSLT